MRIPKISGISDINRFIETEIMSNQWKYILYIVGGLIALIVFLFWMN